MVLLILHTGEKGIVPLNLLRRAIRTTIYVSGSQPVSSEVRSFPLSQILRFSKTPISQYIDKRKCVRHPISSPR